MVRSRQIITQGLRTVGPQEYGSSVFDAEMPQGMIGGYDSCLTVEFMRALAMNGGLTLHQKCHYGSNAHHITEGLFKSLGLAAKEAIRVEGDQVVSTKGLL